MKTKIKLLRKQFEKHKIIILLVPILFILSLTYVASKSFLAEGQENNSFNQEFQAYKNVLQDNIVLTCGDIDGDENDEILTSTLENRASLKIFNSSGELEDTYEDIFKNNNSNLNIVAGDIDGDGRDEIIKASAENNSIIEVFQDREVISKFRAFKNLNIGISVASGDVNNDGRDEIIVGTGKGGGPQVKVFNWQGEELASFFVFSPSLRNGINVAVNNIDEDLAEEIIVSQKRGGEGVVRIYKLDNIKTSLNTFMAYPNTFKLGANIVSGDLNGDSKAEIITAKDVDNDELEIKMFNATGSVQKINNDIFSKINSKNKIDICDFGDRVGIVLSYQEMEDVKIKVIYNY